MTAKAQAPAKPEPKSLNVDRSNLLQRKCDCGKSSGLSGQCSDCEAKKLLQRRANDPGEVTEVPPIVHEVLRSPGQPLDRETRSFMESRFGHDFSQVRIHTDAKAVQSARSVSALAYTVGKDVVFGSGQYAPQTTAGKKVLAHELTHVLQQGSMSSPAIATLEVGSSNDSYEKEADAQAEKVVSTNEAIATPTRYQTSALQRLGDLTKVPAGLSCPIATSSAPPATDIVLFDNRSVTLSPLQILQLENVVRNWRAAGASTTVRVDGFASKLGADELNWRLSCDRVRAVQAELISPSSGTVPGIPASRIEIFAHGETDEFSSTARGSDRRATIDAPSPPPCGAPPPCPTSLPAPALRNPGIASGSQCRGACGPDCPPTCTPQPNFSLCISDATGNCHFICTYPAVIECGSHQGCRDHDDCYDRCAAAGERDLCPSGSCHCNCDIDCISTHSFSECNSWRRGMGPFDRMLRFSDPPTQSGALRGACPASPTP